MVVATACSAGCGGGSSSLSVPVVPPAKVYHLTRFEPSGPVRPGRPVTVSFTVTQPSGAPLVHYRTGPGPHTGVHLIIVRDDLSAIIHDHPPIGPTGRVSQTVTFPQPGPYHVVVDIYPATRGPIYTNFQLTQKIQVRGRYRPQPIGAFRPVVKVDGYTFRMGHVPRLRVARAALIPVTVTDPQGRLATFTPWFGALGHAIFFHQRDLAYFHTHICAPGLVGCTSIGSSTVSGTSTTPGVLKVGVLLPEAGTWRLFLQCKVDGHILTAPYTLKAAN
ncbi:MAG TPA: hypothetical protein VFQ71_13190 [Gaiellales bacterium]|nr:hypothetical protein [Gaiellales bacterium]